MRAILHNVFKLMKFCLILMIQKDVSKIQHNKLLNDFRIILHICITQNEAVNIWNHVLSLKKARNFRYIYLVITLWFHLLTLMIYVIVADKELRKSLLKFGSMTAIPCARSLSVSIFTLIVA